MDRRTYMNIVIPLAIAVAATACTHRPSIYEPGEESYSWFDQAWPEWHVGEYNVHVMPEDVTVWWCSNLVQYQAVACMLSTEERGPDAVCEIFLPEGYTSDMYHHEMRHCLYLWNPEMGRDTTDD
jgi:hypothetical protein